jgi:hypothetical protein
LQLDDLRQIVSAVDPAVLLVSPRVLRRVLQAEFKVPYLLSQAPHERCYFFDRDVLFRHVEQDELDLEPDHLLPPTVILLARPPAEDLQTLERDELLLAYWQLLFHARVHLALRERQRDGRLGAADIRARVKQIGQTEVGEIRTVLEQENFLLPPYDDATVYAEFVAVYLELRYFRTNLRSTYFPAISDFAAIDRLIALDVDADAVFKRTRLDAAPPPVIRTDTSSDESNDYYDRLMRHASRATGEGDTVRAAILHTKAARVAPANKVLETRTQSIADLERLTKHMQAALQFTPEEAKAWMQVLPALLEKADQGNWPVEAKLLYDLQEVCMEHERKAYALDLIEWAITAGKRPIKRPLASLQLVRITRHLRSASQRLTMARISDEDRQRLAKLLQSALTLSANRMRERFRPILRETFHDVGLIATSPPEAVAAQKIIEELLDRIIEYGFFTFSDLRDTLSQNQLKMPDLTDPYSYWRGDPLLRLDRRLAPLMEGVYRHGEFYLRWMESTSSLFFGTDVGRFLTLNFLVPFGGAFVTLRGGQLALESWHLIREGPALPWLAYFLVGILFLTLIRSEALRGWLSQTANRLYWGARFLVYELPVHLWRLEAVQEILRSWPVLLLYWYVLRPLAISGAIWLYMPMTAGWAERFVPAAELSRNHLTAAATTLLQNQPFATAAYSAYFVTPPGSAALSSLPAEQFHLSPWRMGATFLIVYLVLFSRFGSAAGEAVAESFVLLYGWLRFDVIQNLLRRVNQLFKRITNVIESLLYTIDEWLRFRSDESRLTMVARAVLGVLWFPVGYFIRLYFIVLLEPSLNPLKLPISILAAKFLYTNHDYYDMVYPGCFTSTKPQQLIQYLAPHVGGPVLSFFLTWGFIIPTLWLLGSAFAFLVWEMQTNWRLFRANRPALLRKVIVGKRGETVLQLLEPGVHSGTILRLFTHLRAAERNAYRNGDWRPARTYRLALQDVARSVQVFVEREVIALLEQSKSWANQPIRVEQIALSCTRIRIELCHAHHPLESAWLALEEHFGWLISSLQEAGWLRHLSTEQQQVMTSALAGLYKFAGVDLVREQLIHLLPADVPNYEITAEQLLLWKGERNGQEVYYDLASPYRSLPPRQHNGKVAERLPALDAQQLFFCRVPITWEQWVECWRKDHAGQGHTCLFQKYIPLFNGAPCAKSS